MAEKPDFSVARVTKEYSEGTKTQAVNLFSMLKAAKKSGYTIEHATDAEKAVYALQTTLQKVVTPKDGETISKTAVKKHLRLVCMPWAYAKIRRRVLLMPTMLCLPFQAWGAIVAR